MKNRDVHFFADPEVQRLIELALADLARQRRANGQDEPTVSEAIRYLIRNGALYLGLEAIENRRVTK